MELFLTEWIISEYDFTVSDINFKITDVGGEREERAQWIDFLSVFSNNNVCCQLYVLFSAKSNLCYLLGSCGRIWHISDNTWKPSKFLKKSWENTDQSLSNPFPKVLTNFVIFAEVKQIKGVNWIISPDPSTNLAQQHHIYTVSKQKWCLQRENWNLTLNWSLWRFSR